MNSIKNLHQLGQSIWYDNIERKLLKNGEMEQMVLAGDIRGVTSNPSIFQSAISKSTDYDEALRPMAWSGWSPEEIFFQLAVEDIRQTADIFTSLYDSTAGGDGYVSLEVNPELAYDSEGTFNQAVALWQRVNRKNLMVKIPATKAGLPAIRRAIAAGLNINVTLIFSVERYSEVIDAYMSGLEDRAANGLPINSIASVASFFVSRVDSKIDKILEDQVKEGKITSDQAMRLSGKAAIANSKLAYKLYESRFASQRFQTLAAKGARVQRPLWASTSTKNPAYSDVLYVEELIGPDTVNTMPPSTLVAYKDHGKAATSIRNNLDEVDTLITELEACGIQFADITRALEEEGVNAFAASFKSLLTTIEQRKRKMLIEIVGLEEQVQNRVAELESDHSVTRIFEKDASFWTDNPQEQEEIRNRLGWLDAPFIGKNLITKLETVRDELIDEGFKNVVLLGMGGSSLAAEVLSLSFRGSVDGMSLSILDSTDPRQVKELEEKYPLDSTIFLVSSKSGSTSEVQAFLSYFYELGRSLFGDKAGKHFIAITDPGTSLEKQAMSLNFRAIIHGDPTVGGRYSALTAFGLVPAVLIGVELGTFLTETANFALECRPGIPAGRNPGLLLGVILAEAMKIGRDKLTIIAEEPFASFGSWMEQLIAESTGKAGKGIIPVDMEPIVKGNNYGNDRFFIYLKNDGIYQSFINDLRDHGQPVIPFDLVNAYQIGAEFFRWEFATAIASGVMGVNAFDQPDVQDNKTRTRNNIQTYLKQGKFNEGDPAVTFPGAKLFSGNQFNMLMGNTLREVIMQLLEQTQRDDYVAINAYLPRNDKMQKELQKFRSFVLKKTGNATTLGFGPRFLHSTGQLHKGGGSNGFYLQITDDAGMDLEIPGENISFDVLLRAQALGDYNALVARNKRVIRIHLTGASIKDLWN
jgi:transaldolase/glucose-6-phosphate isomerase